MTGTTRTGWTCSARCTGWTVVSWPRLGAIVATEAARVLSERLPTLASCVSVYDGDFWIHLLFDNGQEQDRFCSRPDYFDEDPQQAASLFARWTGNPRIVASTTGAAAAEIAPYLAPLRDEDYEEDEDRRAHPDDHSDLRDIWVFVDFWRHLGISYPTSHPLRRVKFAPGWDTALPTSTSWSL